MLGAQGLSLSGLSAIDLSICTETGAGSTKATPPAYHRVVLDVSTLWLPTIRRALANEGWTVIRKQVQHIRRREGLKVRPKPKKIPRCGMSTGLPTQAAHRHHVWTWDFIFDRTDSGGMLKMMTLLDEYTRQCLTIRVERRITSAQVIEVLEKAIRHSRLGYLSPEEFINSQKVSS